MLLLLFRFNYRSTHYLVENGYYSFLNWFDERAWYPLGRIVGGTVSVAWYCNSVTIKICLFNIYIYDKQVTHH